MPWPGGTKLGTLSKNASDVPCSRYTYVSRKAENVYSMSDA